MVWLNSILIGMLTAAVAALSCGFVASLAVDWYQITGREGASGYFIAAIGIVGLLGGFVIGCICGGVVRPESFFGVLKASGLALGIVVSLTGIAAFISRSLADIPPTIDGEELFLIVEIRLPATQTSPPAAEPGDASLVLGSLPWGGHVIRKTERGPLWVDDAQLIDGRWVVRGAVEVFTQRGKRLLLVTLGSKYSQGFLLPLPANPGKEQMQWSDWLPPSLADPDPSPKQMEYRFRVQRWSEPMKVESLGPFEIDTITRNFYSDSKDGTSFIAGRDTFHVRYRGQPVSVQEPIRSVASFRAPEALLVSAKKSDEMNAFYLLRVADGALHVDWIADDIGDNILTLIPSPTAVPGPMAPQNQPGRYRSPDRRELTAGTYRVGYNGIFDSRVLQR